ncbi:MAG: mobile mystery protein A [Pseudomonadota bacterium]
MKKSAKLARRRLDERLGAFVDLGSPPPLGWVRAIRDSLGLTAAQLARRLNIRPSSVADLEKNEAEGKVTLATLRRAAEAMDCTLVYALIPKKSLETMVEEAAQAAAKRELAASLHTMELEAQGVRGRDRREMLDALAAEIAEAGGRRLWGETAKS